MWSGLNLHNGDKRKHFKQRLLRHCTCAMIFTNKGESLLQLMKRTTGAGLLEVKRVPANKPAPSEAPAPSDATGSISGMPSSHCCLISLLPHLTAASPHCCLSSLLPQLTAAWYL